MNHWIFQANPDVFDVDTYLNTSDEILWSVRQVHYLERMGVGDKVFIWRAQGRSFQNRVYGIIAGGTISSRSHDEQADASGLWRSDVPPTQPEEFEVPISLTK